jgi:hypothetical protein
MTPAPAAYCTYLLLLGCLLLPTLPDTADAAEQLPTGIDSRVAYSATAPQWLRAVGKLQVPGNRVHEGHRVHHREDCSATLVARAGSDRADTIITAWHCLEFYNDLSRPITFTLMPGLDQHFTSEAYRLADGGGMHADWAVLRLQQPVISSTVTPLGIHPVRADPGRTITMAGYSRDDGLGNNGEQLTFDPACRITAQQSAISQSNCRAFKGASGGAVIQLSGAGEAQVCGVISQGDGAGLSTFVPVGGFRNAVDRALR